MGAPLVGGLPQGYARPPGYPAPGMPPHALPPHGYLPPRGYPPPPYGYVPASCAAARGDACLTHG